MTSREDQRWRRTDDALPDRLAIRDQLDADTEAWRAQHGAIPTVPRGASGDDGGIRRQMRQSAQYVSRRKRQAGRA